MWVCLYSDRWGVVLEVAMGYEARLRPFYFLGTRDKGQAHSREHLSALISLLRVATLDISREIENKPEPQALKAVMMGPKVPGRYIWDCSVDEYVISISLTVSRGELIYWCSSYVLSTCCVVVWSQEASAHTLTHTQHTLQITAQK